MKLYSYYRSSAAYRVRIALNLKNIDYAIESIDLRAPYSQQRSPEYLETNPQGLVPALKIGETVLTQSAAIIEYLEEAYPVPSLLPESAEDRAYVRALAQIIACDIHPLNNLRILDYRASERTHNEHNNLPWYHHWVALGFDAFEQLLASRACEGRYCFAGRPGIADAFLIPQVYNAIRYECDLQNYSLIRQIYAHCTGLDAFMKAAPEAQADALVPV